MLKGRKYKAVIFDLDGTLLDTSTGILSSVKHVINEMNLGILTEDEMKSFIGPPVQESFKRIYNMDDETVRHATELFRNRYKKYDLLKAEYYPGIVGLLEDLVNHQIKIGVATYKREDYAIQLLEKTKLTPYMDCIFGGDNDNQLTKQDIINKCIKTLDVELTKIVMIGDTGFDAIGAKNSCIDFIGVTYGFGFKSSRDLQDYEHIGVANNVFDLSELLLF